MELVRRDVLAAIIPALPVPAASTSGPSRSAATKTAPSWLVRLHGTHVLLAGSTGAGKASLIWGLIRGILPALADGTARILGADPKLMELAYGRALFDRYGRYESDPALDRRHARRHRADMQVRAAAAGRPEPDHFADYRASVHDRVRG